MRRDPARPVGLRDELRAELAAQTEERRRAEQVARKAGLELRERLQRRVRLRPGDDDSHEVAERRVTELAPPLELARQEARDVVAGGELDRARIGLERLHEHAPRRVTPAAARQLRQQLERALLGAEVREPEPRVGIDHGGERDAGEVVALRHHLRPDEDDAVGGRETRERRRECTRALDRVGVEPNSLQLRHLRFELALEPLRAGSEPRELRRPAQRTRLRFGLRVAAVVAAQKPVRVQDERDVTVLAAERRPARAAVQGRRDAAAVQQEDRLAAAVRDRAQFRQQRRRERIAGLAAQVDHAHGRQRAGETAAELQPLEAAPGLRPRRRAAEHRDGSFQRSPLRGDGARVVARVGLLLVRRVVLLVDADDAEPRDGRKHRRTRADDDLRVAACDARAFVPPLCLGQRRMEHGDALAEARAKAAECLRRERDLGHEHDRPATTLERRGAGLQVHLRLAAAGRPVEEVVGAFARIEAVDDAG